MPPFIDLTGQKFGRLTVTSLAHGGRVAKWNCRCECTGEMAIVRGSALRIGKTKSCGCLIGIVARTQTQRLLALVGRKFGRWTVEKYEGNSRWLCRCECGTIAAVKTDALTGGDSRSCGCLHKDRAAARLTARRNKQAQARVGQTNGHLRCDAYIGNRDHLVALDISSVSHACIALPRLKGLGTTESRPAAA